MHPCPCPSLSSLLLHIWFEASHLLYIIKVSRLRSIFTFKPNFRLKFFILLSFPCKPFLLQGFLKTFFPFCAFFENCLNLKPALNSLFLIFCIKNVCNSISKFARLEIALNFFWRLVSVLLHKSYIYLFIQYLFSISLLQPFVK